MPSLYSGRILWGVESIGGIGQMFAAITQASMPQISVVIGPAANDVRPLVRPLMDDQGEQSPPQRWTP